MKKRFTFRCWNCARTYSLFKEITDQQELIVPCPFCNREAVVKLDRHRKEKKPIFRGADAEAAAVEYEYQFPEIIPTQEPD